MTSICLAKLLADQMLFHPLTQADIMAGMLLFGNEQILKNNSVPLGPETEAFFDEAEERFRNNPQPDPAPMTGSDRSPADLNGDGVEDSLDLDIFMEALGTCFGQKGYNPEADLNMDGCVTEADKKMLIDFVR